MRFWLTPSHGAAEDADENTELPPQPAVDIAKRVVKKLTHDEYNPDNFPNPGELVFKLGEFESRR